MSTEEAVRVLEMEIAVAVVIELLDLGCSTQHIVEVLHALEPRAPSLPAMAVFSFDIP